MTTLRKTVIVSPDRRVRFDLTLPDDVPTGEIEVTVEFVPADESRRRNRELLRLAGSLADSQTFARDAVESQREMRDEW